MSDATSYRLVILVNITRLTVSTHTRRNIEAVSDKH